MLAAIALALLAATPLPESVKVLPPAADLPRSVAAYSGTWHGSWRDGPEHTLVVERIEGTKASLIYSWGVAPQGKAPQKPGFRRVSGVIDEKGVLRATLPNGAEVAYRWAGDDRVFAEWTRGERVFRAILQRR